MLEVPSNRAGVSWKEQMFPVDIISVNILVQRLTAMPTLILYFYQFLL